MSRPSWFEFTTAILGLIRKRASPCIKKGLNALQQWSTGGHWKYMLINVRQPFTVGILIMNTKLQILSLINRVGKSSFRERFRCGNGIWFRSFAFPVRHFPVLQIQLFRYELTRMWGYRWEPAGMLMCDEWSNPVRSDRIAITVLMNNL